MVNPQILAALTGCLIVLTTVLGKKLLYRQLDPLSQIVLGLGNSVLIVLACAAYCSSLDRFSQKAFILMFTAYSLLGVIIWIYTLVRDKRLCSHSEEVRVLAVAQHELSDKRKIIAPALLLITILACYHLPSQIVVGSQDPSVYVAAAAAMAETRNTEVASPILNTLTEEQRQSLLGLHANKKSYNWVYNGVYLFNDGSAKYRFDFLRGPSLLLGFAFLFEDKEAAFYTNSLYSLLAIFYFFLLLRVFLTETQAFFGSLLLLLCPAELWFGRANYSEVSSQFAILSAFLHLTWFEFKGLSSGRNPPHPRLTPELLALFISCFSAAISLMMRADQAVVPMLLILGLPLLSFREGIRRYPVFFAQVFLLICTALVVIFHQQTGAHYLSRLKRNMFFSEKIIEATAICLILSLPLYIGSLKRAIKCSIVWLRRALFSDSAQALLLTLLVGFLVWELVFRVTLFPHQMFGAEAAHNAFKRTMNEVLFHRLAILTGTPVLLLSFFGMWQMLKKSPSCSMIFLLGLFAIYASTLFITQSNSPMLFWASRRYLPVIVPTTIFFGVSFLFSLRPFAEAISNRILIFGLFAISIYPMIYIGQTLIPHGEMNGAITSVLTLEKRFEPSHTVILSDSSSRHKNFTFRFLGQYPVLQIKELETYSAEVPRLLPGLVENLTNNGKRVLLFIKDPQSPLAKGLELANLERIEAPYKRLGEPFTHFPRETWEQNNGTWFTEVASFRGRVANTVVD